MMHNQKHCVRVYPVNAATLVLGMENQHKISVPKAPTKDEVSLRAYTASCRMNRLRRAACSLFTSENMVKAIKKLEIEIEVGRLLVRKDRHLWKDIGKITDISRFILLKYCKDFCILLSDRLYSRSPKFTSLK